MYHFVTFVSSYTFELVPVVLAAMLSVFILKSRKPISLITRLANVLFILTFSFIFLMSEIDVNMKIYWMILAATGGFMLCCQIYSGVKGEFKEPVPAGYIMLDEEYSSPFPLGIRLLFGVVVVLAILNFNYLSMVIGTVLLWLFTIISFFFVTKKDTFYINVIFSVLCAFSNGSFILEFDHYLHNNVETAGGIPRNVYHASKSPTVEASVAGARTRLTFPLGSLRVQDKHVVVTYLHDTGYVLKVDYNKKHY
ncbi:hypothetical protein [Rossellomorea sp. NPDC077527]|uniref:hypothetical protein n=1 Tax=Rossellomorea sp. NPDC077527 TaxID=3364510 RepID=UPI0037C6C215